MPAEIEIPDRLPVMTLANTVFFPHVMLPLYIFEPRYRQMLETALAGNRLFVVAREDVTRGHTTGEFEPPFPVATVGMIRACHQEADGASHLILQGLSRVRFRRILKEEPYRMGEFETLQSDIGDQEELASLRQNLTESVRQRLALNPNTDEQVLTFLESHEDPDTFVDVASFTLCEDHDLKQELLETLDTARRSQRLSRYLKVQIDQLRLEKQLRGNLRRDDLHRN